MDHADGAVGKPTKKQSNMLYVVIVDLIVYNEAFEAYLWLRQKQSRPAILSLSPSHSPFLINELIITITL